MVAVKGSGWKLAPCLVVMFDEADRRWPNRSHASDGSIGDTAHQARASDHNPSKSGYVTAGDLTDDKANGCDADLFAEWLRTSRDPRVKYVICNRRVFRSYGSSPWEWTPYTGENPHDKHTHVSVNDDAASRDDLSPWFSYADAPDPAQEDDDMPLTAHDLDLIAAKVKEVVLDIVRKEGISGAAGGIAGYGSVDHPANPVSQTVIDEIRKFGG